MERCHKAQTTENSAQKLCSLIHPYAAAHQVLAAKLLLSKPEATQHAFRNGTCLLKQAKAKRESKQQGKDYPCTFLSRSELKCTSGQIIGNTMSFAKGLLW